MSGERVDLADLEWSISASYLFATGVGGIPAILERLGAIKPLLDGRIRMERADAPTYSVSSAAQHGENGRDRGIN